MVMATTPCAECTCKNFCVECNLAKCRPQQEFVWAPGTLATEYTVKYPGKSVPREVREKKPFVPSVGRFKDMTTNKADFTPKTANRISSSKKGSFMPQVPFDGISTYQEVHNGKAGAPSSLSKKAAPEYSAPFYGVSSNRADFIDHGVQTRPSRSAKYDLVNIPFEGASTYKSDFDEKARIANAPRVKPGAIPSHSLDNYTTYAVDFVPKPFGKKACKGCCDDMRHTAIHSGRLTNAQLCDECGGH